MFKRLLDGLGQQTAQRLSGPHTDSVRSFSCSRTREGCLWRFEERSFQLGQHHTIKLKSLALMDRHDTDQRPFRLLKFAVLQQTDKITGIQ